MNTRKCKICGKEFIPSHPKSKFCSVLCKDMNTKIYSKNWRAQNKDYMTIYMRDYRENLRRQSSTKV